MSELVVAKSRTMSDVVYEKLKEDIVSLCYKPGERLSEAKIAEKYGVSRDSTRKGITRLVQEGLLISRPQYGTIVSELSIKQGCDVCDIRVQLETYAVKAAVENMEIEILLKLKGDFERLWERIDDDAPEIIDGIYALDRRMHDAIYIACGNEMVSHIIHMYSSIIRRIQVANMTSHGERKHETMAEMGRIIEALVARDENAAETAMRDHINNIKKTFIK